MLKEIYRILDEEQEVFVKLIELYEEKKTAIIENNIERIRKIIASETALLETANTLSKNRERAIIAFMKEKKVQGRFRLETVIRNVDVEDASKLVGIRDAMVQSFKKLKEINEINRIMTEDNLAYLNYTLELFAGDGKKDSGTYSHLNPMKKNSSSNRSILDKKA